MDLRVGERLKNLSGDTVYVQQKLPRPGPTPVYNLEVQDEHVYYVGTNGVLAHNAGKDGCEKKRLSDPNPVPKPIREAYEEIILGNGVPNLDPNGVQKVFSAIELKRQTGASTNYWEGSTEWLVPGTNHRILRRFDGTLGYVLHHDYTKPKKFPSPWYPDGE